MSVHRFIPNNLNLFRTATVGASSVATAANAVRKGAPLRSGNSRGTVALIGSYTGAADATFDIEITGGTSTTSRVSAPIFIGAGSSTIENLAVTDAVVPQTFEITLRSLGIDAKKAAVGFYGVKLRARDTGADGNDINITVSTASIVKTSLDIATLDDIPEEADGQSETRLVGPEWDFGGAFELTADGDLNPNTKRIAFGDDPQVYRSWRTLEKGQEVYYFDPPIARAIPGETIVYEVTGSYTVTVTDGTTPEVFTDIVTLYDLLANLVTSGHVEVDGVIVEDRTPGGMAVDELPLRTASFALPVEAEGSDFAGVLESVTVGANVPTQAIQIQCTDNDVLGAERWSVAGSVAGPLAAAVTDILYASSATPGSSVGFKIPRKIPDGFPTSGAISITGSAFAADPAPHLCDDLFRPVIGALASNKTFTLTWTNRPTDDCDCEALKGSVVGGPDPECLGVDVRYLGVSTNDYRYRRFANQFQKSVSDFIAGQTALGTSIAHSDQYDQQLAELADLQFHRALGTIFGNSDAVLDDTYIPWATGTAKTEGDFIISGIDILVAGNDGTTGGGSEPTWDVTDYGDTTADNGITWIYYGKTPLSLISTMISTIETDLANWAGVDVPAVDDWKNLNIVVAGQLVQPSAPNAHYYMALTSGLTDASEPAFPTNGGTVTDGDVVWEDQGAFAGDSIKVTSTTGAIGSVMSGMSASLTDFAKKYKELANEIIAAAQLDLGKTEAGDLGTGCWRDDPSAIAYFAVTDGSGRRYMPLFPGIYWHSTIRVIDPETGEESIQSTKEIGFAVLMCNTDLLTAGDTITVSVNDVVQNRAYQVGDRFRLPIIKRSPLFLQGGVDGDNAHVWAVRGTSIGALPDYDAVNGAEAAYDESGVSFDGIFRGPTPNQVGDKFSFAVERTQFRWRKDGGSYSSALDIDPAAVSLSDGLSALFSAGAGVSFQSGDLFPFVVRQPYSPAHVQAGDSDGWTWAGATADITLTAGSDQTIDAVCIGRHLIPEGATITASGLNISDVEQWSQVLNWSRGPIVHLFATDQICRKVRISLTSGTGGSIQWIWAGLALDFTLNATEVKLSKNYLMARSGARGRSRYIGRGAGGEISWTSFFKQADADNLYSMLDHIKEQGNEPVVFLPHKLHAEARLVQIDDDEIIVEDTRQFHPNATGDRLLSVRMPLTAVIL